MSNKRQAANFFHSREIENALRKSIASNPARIWNKIRQILENQDVMFDWTVEITGTGEFKLETGQDSQIKYPRITYISA